MNAIHFIGAHSGASLLPADDERVRCSDCSHYRRANSHCFAHVRAGLSSPDVGRTLATTPQRCPAFSSRNQTPTGQREQWPAFSLKPAS